MTTTPYVRALGDLAHDSAHPRTPVCDCGQAEVLADRADGTVVRSGRVVAKAHAPDTDTRALTARLALAAAPPLTGILLPPLLIRQPAQQFSPYAAPRPAGDRAPGAGPSAPAPGPAQGSAPLPGPYAAPELVPQGVPGPVPRGAPGNPGPPSAPTAARDASHLVRVPLAGPIAGGRPASLWPYGEPVDPSDPDAAPWEEAAVLLARLHRTRPPHPLPPMRGPAKAALAVGRMRAAGPDGPATGPVLAAWRGLPAWARDAAPAPAHRAGYLCHGDLHLGQLVRHPAPHGPWLLIDVDDSGLGDPAWDLARPAAWYAAGLLPPEVWLRFLNAYRAAGGPAVRGDGDPWPELDVPARALTVQTAALAFAKSAAEGRSPDEVEQIMIDACARIASLPPELAAGHSS